MYVRTTITIIGIIFIFSVVVIGIPSTRILYVAENPIYNIPPAVHASSTEEKESSIIEEQEVVDNDTDYLKPNCSCMIYLINRGIDIHGDAIDLKPNYWGVPKRGDVIIFHYPKVGHSALIEEVYPGGYYVSEANYRKCEYSERLVQKDDPFIYGFIRANNPFDQKVGEIDNNNNSNFMDENKTPEATEETPNAPESTEATPETPAEEGADKAPESTEGGDNSSE